TSLAQFVGSDLNHEVLRRLLKRMTYRVLEFREAESFDALRDWIDASTERRIFYFATPAAVYADICAGLDHAGFIRPDSQVIMEKPIGDSLKSSKVVNDLVGSLFTEDQIYRTDHY